MRLPATLPRVHRLPLLALVAAVCLYYVPQLTSGTVQYDGVDVHYSAQRYFSDALRAGRLPFWTPLLFSGFPFLADLQVGAWYPLNWPFFLAGIAPISISLELALHTLIAGVGAYALGMRYLARPLPALAVSLFYALSGYFAAHSQHVGMFQAAAWLPALVLALDHLGDRLSWPRLALAGILGAALALPGHFQVALYAASGGAVWALLEAAARRDLARVRRVAVALVAVGAWGALLSAVMILPALELVGLSVRTRLDARASDLGYFQPDALWTLVQPDHYGLLAGRYVGPGDVTQHYFYAGILLVPLALLGLVRRRGQPARTALLLGGPFLWYALGPAGGLFRAVVRLPGFGSVELPMHGWFLPALGLALLAGSGCAWLAERLPGPVLAGLLIAAFADVLFVNQVQLPLAYARQSFDALYGEPLRALQPQVRGVQRLYGPPLTAVGYRNHALQSGVETTYGYNPLELTTYADYADAAETNPWLIDGLAATHRLTPDGIVAPNPTALPLAFFARATTTSADLAHLDPAAATLVGDPFTVTSDPLARVTLIERGDDYLTLHYRSVASTNLLRVAIPNFPGWRADLGGAELPLLTVDHAFIGIVVPPGEDDIRLAYEPRLFWLGAAVSILALNACLAARIASTHRAVQRNRTASGAVVEGNED